MHFLISYIKTCIFNKTLIMYLTNNTEKNLKNHLLGFFQFYKYLVNNFAESIIFTIISNLKCV